MKKIFIIISCVLAAVSSQTVAAQGRFGADSAQCIKYLSYYQEYYKQKSYADALPNWRKAYHYCPPTASQNMLLNGMTLVRQLIGKNAANKEYKAALIDTLMNLHNLRIENYPSYKTSALNSKGQDIFNYIRNDNEKLHREYSAIIAANGEKTKPSFFVYDFNAVVNLFKSGAIGAEDVMNVYQSNMDCLNAITPKDDAEAEQLNKTKSELESRFVSSNVASCQNLLELLTPRLNAAPDDLALAKSILKMLSVADDCTDNDLFIKAVTTVYKQEPSYTSAYYLYRLNASRNNFDDAVKYMKEAIAYPESDSKTDAEYNFELATYCYKNGRSDLAYNYASQAAELDASCAGKAYFLIGNIWGATSCGGDEIAKRAQYWVAVDYMIKARNADPSLSEEAGKYIGMYSKYFPQTADAFMYDIHPGNSYTVVCHGMRANTTVRTQN